MKKILFFTENNWVFGKIHNELIKALYPDVYCDILEYTYQHNADNISMYMDKYDYFLSNTWGAYMLHFKYGVPANRIVGIAHGEIDLHLISQKDRQTDLDFISNLKGYGVISPFLHYASVTSDIKREPIVLRIGLHTDLYNIPKKTKLETLGYFGAFRVDYGRGDIKRGYLAQQVAQLTGLQFLYTQMYHFLAIEPLYKQIDILAFCSLTEGNPYSSLEALAAGIPVIGTPTGIFPNLINSGGGKLLPFDENEYIKQAVEYINELKNNNALYLDTCEKAAEQGKKLDWRILRNDWINYIYSL